MANIWSNEYWELQHICNYLLFQNRHWYSSNSVKTASTSLIVYVTSVMKTEGTSLCSEWNSFIHDFYSEWIPLAYKLKKRTGLTRLSVGLNSRTLCSDSDWLEEKVSQGFCFIYICGKVSVAEGLFLVSKVKYCLSPFRNMNTLSWKQKILCYSAPFMKNNWCLPVFQVIYHYYYCSLV